MDTLSDVLKIIDARFVKMVKENSADNHSTPYAIIIVVLLTSAYAIIRYNVFGNIPWNQLPLFILNKALSFSGLILLTLNPLNKLFPKLINSKQTFRNTGFVFIFIHILLSLILMSPINFSNLYSESGLFTAFGGISLTSGIIAFTILLIYIFFRDNKYFEIVFHTRGIMLLFMLLPLIHLFFLGYDGWTTPQKWQGGMPPITLLSFFVYSISYVTSLIDKSDNNSIK